MIVVFVERAVWWLISAWDRFHRWTRVRDWAIGIGNRATWNRIHRADALANKQSHTEPTERSNDE